MGSGSANLKSRLVHRIIGGGFNHGASAGFGAKGTEQAVVLVAGDQVSPQSLYSQLTMPVTATVTALQLRLHYKAARVGGVNFLAATGGERYENESTGFFSNEGI